MTAWDWVWATVAVVAVAALAGVMLYAEHIVNAPSL
jgi:hypothetical protein